MNFAEVRKWYQSSKRLLALSLIGAAFILLFGINKACIAQADLAVASNLPHVRSLVIYFNFALAPLSVLLWYVLEHTNGIRPRTLAILTLVIFAILALTGLLTPPTQSQDIFHSLLLVKGFIAHGLNPYTTTPEFLHQNPWAGPVQFGKNIPMPYGPLWVYMVSLAVLLGGTLPAALLFIKVGMLVVLLAAGAIFCQVMGIHGIISERRWKIVILLAWSPFIIQNVLIDAHNDTVLLLAILAGYYLFAKKQYVPSMLALILGGFVKYVTWPLVLVPAIYLIKEKCIRRSASSLLVVALFWLLSGVLLYAPFGGAGLKGIFTHLTLIGDDQVSWPGTILLRHLFSLNFAQLNSIGVLFFMVTLGISLWRAKPILSFTLPYLAMFFFGNPWFQPWYMLWILPLLALEMPLYAFTGLLVFLMLLLNVGILPILILSLSVGILVMTFIKSRRYMYAEMKIGSGELS